ncbi:MAG: polyprenyl synthetase family protein [Promethearchaeota archaeon]
MMDSSLDLIFQHMNRLGKSVESKMLDFLLVGIQPEFQDLVAWQTKTGGKRLRPALTLLFAQAFGAAADNPEVLAAAAGIELIHSYSLILDDIIDRAELRRGKHTVRTKYGDEFAILAAIIHREAIYEAAKATGKYSEFTAAIYSKAIRELTEGERLDILFEQKEPRSNHYFQKYRYFTVTLQDYLTMIKGKTASLLAAACKLGTLIGGGTLNEQSCAEKYGWSAGIAFQLADDYLDIFATSNEFGKVVYKDIIEQKLGNFVIVQALELLKEEEAKLLNQYLSDPTLSKEDRVNRCLPFIEKTNVKEIVRKEAEKWANKAKTTLSTINLKSENIRDILERIAELAVKRAF